MFDLDAMPEEVRRHLAAAVERHLEWLPLLESANGVHVPDPVKFRLQQVSQRAAGVDIPEPPRETTVQRRRRLKAESSRRSRARQRGEAVPVRSPGPQRQMSSR